MLKIWLTVLFSSMVLLPAVYAQTSTTTTTTPAAPATEPAYTVAQGVPDPALEFEGLYWIPKLSGHVNVNNDNQDTDVNFKSDLGLRDDHGVPGGSITWNMNPDSSIRATYMYLDYSGSNDLSRTVVFDGQTYPVRTPVDSRLITQYFSVGWLWNFIHADDNRFSGGLVLDVEGISSKASLDAPAYGIANSERFTGAAPTPGLSLKYRVFDGVSVFTEAEGLPAGHYGFFLDAQGGLKWDIVRDLALSAGYRIIDVKVDYSDSDSGALTLKGPFAALTLKF